MAKNRPPMTPRYFVKIKDRLLEDTQEVAAFVSQKDAESYKSKLMSGSAGEFGRQHEIWVEKTKEVNYAGN